MKFTKMHGAGNDYVYVNGFDYKSDWSKLSEFVSDRHTGIGSDGLIVALPSITADVRMRMFNADGSEGDMCGNGIRCLVAFGIEQNILSSNTDVKKIETKSGILGVTPEFSAGQMVGARVSMGIPDFVPSNIPVSLDDNPNPVLGHELVVDSQRIQLGFVSMGNPHAFAFMEEDVDDFPLDSLGPLVENNPIFPNRINFEINNVLGRDRIKTRVWERGSGLTMACGTGACAVVAIAHQRDMVDEEVFVDLPGGSLKINWDGVGDVYMTGPVETVFHGELDIRL